jgi:hypothetical protein
VSVLLSGENTKEARCISIRAHRVLRDMSEIRSRSAGDSCRWQPGSQRPQ